MSLPLLSQTAAIGCAAYSFVVSYVCFRLLGMVVDLHVPQEARIKVGQGLGRVEESLLKRVCGIRSQSGAWKEGVGD